MYMYLVCHWLVREDVGEAERPERASGRRHRRKKDKNGRGERQDGRERKKSASKDSECLPACCGS